MRQIISALLLAAVAITAQAEVQEKAVTYDQDGTSLTGYLYWDEALEGKRPGVLVFDEWWGLTDYGKRRARMLAEMGYVAFVGDMYGEGKTAGTAEQARELMQGVTADVDLWRERAGLALEQIRSSELTDPERIAAIGYCFGGGTILQLAYGGADLKGIIGFHSSLPAAPDEAKGQIKPRILILLGEQDSFVSPEVIANFRDKLDAAEADWELGIYGGVRHGFTNPGADKRGIENLKYDPVADARSWARTQAFLEEVLAQ
jgi:dienelactone hydrolase